MKHKKFKRLVILSILSLLLIIFFIWQNNDIVISNYVYKTSKLDNSLNGFKIAQLSDLHNKEFGKNQKKLLDILVDEAPDIIVITGDIVDSKNTNIDIALKLVKGASQIAPVYYVTGNHELWLKDEDRNALLQGLQKNGVTLVDNKAVTVEKETDKGFHLIGLSDRNISDNTLETLCSRINSEEMKIVLAHEPQYFENYCDAGVDLVLSGHAHGGQIRLPFLGGVFAPGQGFFPEYASGTYIKNNTTMIVNRGLGNSIVPIRVFNRPEVVIITLQKL